jgi:hypothetical protein
VDKMVYYLGADHGGFELKEQIKDWLREAGIPFQDEGNDQLEPEDDYPFYALAVAKALAIARRRDGDRRQQNRRNPGSSRRGRRNGASGPRQK